MAFECRLCGCQKPLGDLVITIQSESQTVRFLDLVQYFCRVELDENPLLPQNVCKTCQISLEEFMVFCDKMETYQQILSKRTYVKKEEIKRQCMIVKSKQISNPDPIVEDALLEEVFSNGIVRDVPISDENLDSPVSYDQTDDTTSTSESTSHFRLRKKAVIETKNCSVVLEKLDIKYVPTDSEYESESEDDVESPLNKRSRLKSESPGKRMRLSFPVNSQQTNIEDDKRRVVLAGPLSTQSNFKNYYKLFQTEFGLKYNESCFNMPVPVSVRSLDGSIINEYAQQLRSWNSIELKCLIKGCDKKKVSPYELLLHNQTHQGASEKFIKCSLCPTLITYNFTQYVMHAINDHFGNLRYSCVICSKLHFNLTALFNHYQNAHVVFFTSSGIQMCLYDGHFFESFTSLERHFRTHGKGSKAMKIPKMKLEYDGDKVIQMTQNLLQNGHANLSETKNFNCEICDKVFRTSTGYESHKKSHNRKYSCKICHQGFHSNYSLIVHEKSEH